MMATQREYATALTYLGVAHSLAFWKTKKDARKEFTRLGSKTAKLEAVKFQIRIHVIGFGWKDLHHPWSERGVDFLPEQLMTHLCDVIIPEQKKRGIPKQPKLELPYRKCMLQLGTKAADVEELDDRYKMRRKWQLKVRFNLENHLKQMDL